jgi:hypothetical protein
MMNAKQLIILITSFSLLLFFACSKDQKEDNADTKSYLDSLIVPHSMKGYELYSWEEGKDWYFSILVGTNRTKTYSEVIANVPSEIHLATVTGIDNLKLVLAQFPENEFITWIGQGRLQSSWGGNYGNLQLPPQKYIDDITQYCSQKKLNLQVTD